MDKLTELPPKNDTVKTPEEAAIMGQFFPGAEQPPSQQGSFLSRVDWKMVGAGTALFVLLANPWIDTLFCKIPYCRESPIIALVIKTLLFLILTVIIYILI